MQKNLEALWLQLRETWVVHGRDWTKPGFRAVAVYRAARWRHCIRWRPARILVGLLTSALLRRCRNHYGIEISDTMIVGKRFQIGHQGGIVIHPAAVFGDDCLVRQNVTIGVDHVDQEGGPRIGNRVAFGAGAVVIGKVRIGDDVKVGPNSVVSMNIPAGATVFGNPARILQKPTPPLVEGNEARPTTTTDR